MTNLQITISHCLLLLGISCHWIAAGHSANILAIIPAPSPSHHIMQTRILNALAARGHNVTVLSSLPKSSADAHLSSTYHHVYLNMSDASDWSTFRTKMLNNETKTDSAQLTRLPRVMNMLTRRSIEVLQNEFVQQLLRSDQHLDLFVLGYTFNEPLLGIAGHFRCPSVVISPTPALKTIRDLVGNPAAVATTPIFIRDGSGDIPPQFLERFFLFIGYVIEFVIAEFVEQFIQKPIYAEYFPLANGFPTYDEVKKNVSLVLINHHFSQGDFRPMYPNMIEIGGIQIRAEAKPLPVEIEEFVRNAEHGFILFSMGSNLHLSEMNREKFEMFLNVLGKLQQRVIMKYESEVMPAEKPENVLFVKWLPQIDLLAQKNIRLFISHCGLGAIGEATFHGVPILALPIFGDQLVNARLAVSDGWAIQLNVDEANETEFANAIDELLMNNTYTERVKRLSHLYRDRPEPPLETAIYWIEYVLRHQGARHMQSAMVHLNFIQRNSIDVFAMFVVVIYAIAKLIRFILRRRQMRISFLVCVSAAILYWLIN